MSSASSFLLGLTLVGGLLGCGDSPNAPPSSPPDHPLPPGLVLEAQVPIYMSLVVPAEMTMLFRGRLTWRFEEPVASGAIGSYTLIQEVVVPHPNTRLPADRSVLYRSEGQYFLDDCQGRVCNFIFEPTSQLRWNFTRQRMEEVSLELFSLLVYQGAGLVSIGGRTYQIVAD